MVNIIELIYWETPEDDDEFDSGIELKYNGKTLLKKSDEVNIENSFELLFTEIGVHDEFKNFTFENWDYTCGDGCCYEWGIEVKYKDEQISKYGRLGKSTIADVFKEIGIQVEVTEEY